MNQATLFPDGGLPPGLEAAFWEFHEKNPQIYRMICRFSNEAITKGRKRLSINMLFERIRWYTQIETTDEDYKLNNNHRAFYARLWLRDHPGWPDFFALRRQKKVSTI